MHELCKRVSEYVIIVLVVSLVLGASCHPFKDPMRPCTRCSHDETHKFPVLFHYQGFSLDVWLISALIVRLGTTLIYATFGTMCRICPNFPAAQLRIAISKHFAEQIFTDQEFRVCGILKFRECNFHELLGSAKITSLENLDVYGNFMASIKTPSW